MEKPIVTIDRANEMIVKNLIEMGIIYIGEDNQLHVIEPKINKE